MREKLWPSIACMAHATKVSTQNLIEDIGNKICEEFVTDVIIQNTNEISIHAAIDLWHPLKPSEIKTREECNRADIQSYNNLMETLSSLLESDTLQVILFFIFKKFLFMNIQKLGTAKVDNVFIMSSSSKTCADSFVLY
jgi:hypothetical protein